jgi:predicted alpha/beta-hydrolase family hydrolase
MLLPPAGVDVLRFQFPYMELARRVPDRMPLLESTWNAVVDAGLVSGTHLVIGGRSMGGRAASLVAAQGRPIDGLALFAYPLHPPGQPGKRRDAHLSRIKARSLFCSGTRDTFATADELHDLVAHIPGASLHLLEGADHGYQVLKSSGRTRELVWSEAADAFLSWLTTVQ